MANVNNTNNNQPKLVIHPLMKFLFKLWLDIISVGIIVIVLIYFSHWALLDNLLVFSIIVLIMIALMVIAFAYTKTMEFQIFSNEVVVKKGVINRTEKHVPYRTVTNISTRFGFYDKIFGIGTVEIETAGKAGRQSGPEEKIEGISNFVDIRNTVLEELRKFRSQYTTATEPDLTRSEDEITTSILNELKSIKTLLEKQQK